MSRHRESLHPSHSWGLAGVRIAALLTLILGVVGGLYLADQKARHDNAKALQAQQERLAANVVAWSSQNNQDRTLEAAAVAAEKQRQEEAAAQAAAQAAEEAA